MVKANSKNCGQNLTSARGFALPEWHKGLLRQRRALLLGTAAASLSLIAIGSNEALALCAPAPINGGTTNCAGSNTALDTTGVDDLTIIVDASADVTDAGDAITMSGVGQQTLTNNGSIQSNTGVAANITVTGGAGDLSLTSTAGTITGLARGVNANNNGTGDTTITTAVVTGTDSYGIRATNGATADALTINSLAGTVNSNYRAIAADNYGSGALSITTSNVNGGFTGISGTTTGDRLTINSTAGTVTSDMLGVSAYNSGTGDTTITTAAVSVAAGFLGVSAYSGATTDNLRIDSTAGAVTSGQTGVQASHEGTGSLTITTATVTGTGNYGVAAYNAGVNLSIDSTAGTVLGGDNGIDAFNAGSGDLSVTSAGVTGTAGDGIYAAGCNCGGAVTIDSTGGTVTGGVNGIYATNAGSGLLTVTTGTVTATGATGHGIYAYSNGTLGVTVNSSLGIVSGAIGVYGDNHGGGDLSVTTGAVTGSVGDGVYAHNFSDSGSLTVNTSAGTVSGKSEGVRAYNEGNGATIVTTAAVNATDDEAVEVVNTTNGTSMTIDTTRGLIMAVTEGIDAENSGSGDLRITAASVTSTGDTAIEANDYGAGSLIINSVAGTVSGHLGVYGDNHGGGDLTITTGAVTGSVGDGVYGHNSGSGGSLTINTVAGAVSGQDNGVYAYNDGSGAVSVTTAAVTATVSEAVEVYNSSSGTTMTINTTAGLVSAAAEGIDAENHGSGDLMITSGAVTSTANNAIEAINYGAGNVIISTVAGTVTGRDKGILAVNEGAGTLSITSASVASTADIGIQTHSVNGATVNVIAAATVSGPVFAIQTSSIGANTAADTVNLRGTLNGKVALNNGDDSFNLYGVGDISAVSNLDGGTGTGDAFSLMSFTSTVDISNVVNFETFGVTGSTATVGGTASFLTASFNSGDTVLANGLNLTATNGATVSAGAKISVGSGSTATITGNLDHSGGLSLADDGTLVVTGNVAMKSGSSTTFGLQAATNGVVTSGTITLDSGSQTIVDVTSATGLLHNATFVVGTGTTVTNNAGSSVTDNSLLFDFTQSVVDGDKWVLNANQAFFNCGFTNDINQKALCNQVVSLVGSNPDAATILSRLGTITNTAEFLLAIDSLSPGDSFGGQQLSFTFARLFMSSLQDWLDSNDGANPASLSLLEKPKQLWNHPNADWQLWSNSAFSFGFQDAFSTTNSRINDFDSNSTVHVMGLDRNFDDGDRTDGPLRLGVAASYGYGWGEETLTTNSPKQVEQQSFGAVTYAAANYQGYKFSGKLGYAYQWSDHRRHIPILGQTAKADYGSHQLFGQASVEPRQAYRLGEWDFPPTSSA